VLHDADRKTMVELAAELVQLADKARNHSLTPAEMEGGTFTITNLGGIGGTAFTPIVNYPEVAILGLARARWDRVLRDGKSARRLAQGLGAAGLGRGDRVALLASNRPEWIVACLAAIQAGGVVVPLDVQLADDVLLHVLNDSDPQLLFTTAEHAEKIAALAKG